jgi:tagatose-1,6-bisphosphate aldolase
MIKWRKQDYLSLGRAVSNFNKKINELQKEEKKLYLPETVSYKDIKSKIYTRNEFNRVLNSLKRFSKKGAENPVLTRDYNVITKWEQQELRKTNKNCKKRTSKNNVRIRTTIF